MKEKNLEVMKKIFGPAIEKIIQQRENKNPELAKLLEEIPVERVWARSGITLKEKSIVTIASQAALGRWDQVELHCKSFLQLGGTISELEEIFIHLSVYCGFPTTVSGYDILEKIKQENS